MCPGLTYGLGAVGPGSSVASPVFTLVSDKVIKLAARSRTGASGE